MNISLSVKDIGKAYRVGQSRKERLKEWFLPFYKPRFQPSWVLRNVSFDVRQGEAVGIVGMNGAGKSTLLKIITGTTAPTTGTVRFNGRVAALLELGMGFHPDFTGRANLWHSGQLMGLSSEEVAAHMDQIEAFAEIGAAIDEPVRTYSSGMQMRLAFSLATAVRPDMLIVDEALSVGDTYFQHKSFARIREFRDKGTTLLFVSHDKSAVLQLCDRAVLLKSGAVVMDGEPAAVMDYYNAMLAEKQNQQVEQTQDADGATQTTSGTGEVELAEICLRNARGEPVETLDVGEPVTLHVRARVKTNLPSLVFGYGIRDRLGQNIYGTNTHFTDQVLKDVKAGTLVDFDVNFDANLGAGSFSVVVAFTGGATHLESNYFWQDLALVFEVVNLSRPTFVGVSYLPSAISMASH